MTIVLTTEIESVAVNVPAETLCVYHPSYPVPEALRAHQAMPFATFAQSPRAHLAGIECLVLVGMNKIITPSNRTQEVFEVLFNLTPTLRKVSIDRTLFTSEPWRGWFHFGVTNTPYLKYTYSYLAESHYRAFRDKVRPTNPFDLETILACGRGVVRSTYSHYFEPLTVETVSLPESVHREYAELKALCFEEEHTSAGILSRLAAFAQAACPTRAIPTPTQLFRAQAHAVVRTDLKIDQFLVSEIQSLVDLTNGIGTAFYEGAVR